MASTVLDVRTSGATPRPVPAATSARRRPPAAVLGAAGVAVLEALALVAAALTGLDGLLAAPPRPSGAVVVLVLGGLATWVVLCAAGGVTLLDGSGRALLTRVAYGEVVLLTVVLLVGLATPLVDDLPTTLPLPAVLLLALAVPVGKLLLASAPSAEEWLAAGPRSPAAQPQLSEGQRVLRAVTVGVIGVVLGVVALTGPTGGPTDAGFPAPVGQH
ncbi:hypothetical protein [Blastococcus sp. SYSU D00820]